MTSLTARKTDIRRSPLQTALKVLLYLFLLAFMVLALLPFVWMLSSSLKLDKDVFRYPIGRFRTPY